MPPVSPCRRTLSVRPAIRDSGVFTRWTGLPAARVRAIPSVWAFFSSWSFLILTVVVEAANVPSKPGGDHRAAGMIAAFPFHVVMAEAARHGTISKRDHDDGKSPPETDEGTLWFAPIARTGATTPSRGSVAPVVKGHYAQRIDNALLRGVDGPFRRGFGPRVDATICKLIVGVFPFQLFDHGSLPRLLFYEKLVRVRYIRSIRPPSQQMCCPVIKLDSSVARNRARYAISSGVP